MKDANGLRNQLKVIRTRLGLSQQELANVAGIARQTIGGMEAELYAPSAAVALRLAKALGCRVEEIFWLDEEGITVEARSASALRSDKPVRVTLAQVEGKWIAHSLQGDQAFRAEMVPADGIGTWQGENETLSIRLLDEPEALGRTVVLAGCTPVLSLWARSAERWYPGLRVHWTHANSMDALTSLARGNVHAAGLHLYDAATGEHNAPFVRRVIPDRATVLVNLGVWEEGFIVRPGNPKKLNACSDLAQPGIRLANREVGSGARLLLDSVVQKEGVPAAAIDGYAQTVSTHQEVAIAVASGHADVGVTTAAVATIYGMDFIPLQKVRYDLAFLKETIEIESIRQLLSTLQHRWVRSQLAVLGGYDTTSTGEHQVVA